MNPYTVYGIKNCDTVKKTLQWLDSKKIEFEFHDYKTKSISKSKLQEWASQVGWEVLVNKKGTTWRQLDEARKASIDNESAAIDLMIENTSIIKRPVIEKEGKVVEIGFDEKEYVMNFEF